ncbi:ATP-binding protein [Endozoicomonas sp. G2_2]|uniref:ATP-binding protein n=1 Tax=Endozoicomonas sp. G2_2 TaxID=2821092 RepID=UPI001ADA1FBE|nr:ATP-binding protein [Endozoicomonas sp. G2_2]
MQDYEKLGAFYLGREHDLASGKTGTAPLLYDAKDLTTHAVIIGMTGSGKTGLGVGLIEEAAIDGVPVIAIDPKGDLGNLLLTFPDLAAADFEPWVDPAAASTRGKTIAAHASAQAELWRKGLASWNQDGARIRRLKEAAEFGIFTPGSTAGIPISVLSSFDAPSAALRDDAEAFAERIQATAISILTLLGIDADPLSSREYILISNILQHSWQAGRSLDLPGLIGAIQSPPIKRIGVMDLEAMFPAQDRFALAMQLNNLLASPGFATWMQGQALSARSLFYTDEGRPRVSVLSIAHLTDAERMFFVTLLLGEIIAWMRAQPGTSSLRAVLYMDELFGYMPPTANPPSKTLFLTLLKQARAYGLGLVLSTQNPVDLDYKGLSNTGTWFIGRLQTERDKNRVLDGLEGAGAGGGPFDRGAMAQTLAGLGKRVFLLHNVHETEPVVFHTRWALSYLPGPLTREQIRRLTRASAPAVPVEPPPAAASRRSDAPGRCRPGGDDHHGAPGTRPRYPPVFSAGHHAGRRAADLLRAGGWSRRGLLCQPYPRYRRAAGFRVRRGACRRAGGTRLGLGGADRHRYRRSRGSATGGCGIRAACCAGAPSVRLSWLGARLQDLAAHRSGAHALSQQDIQTGLCARRERSGFSHPAAAVRA